CHGEKGTRGAYGARDLTRGPFKGGAGASDIYLRISSGMPGTPMPAYTNSTAAERWAIAYYVESLCSGPDCATEPQSNRADLVAVRSSKHPRPDDPMANDWQSAPPIVVPLHFLWNGRGVPPHLTVRSLYDSSSIAFLLEWNDSTKDLSTVLPESFAD